MVIRDLFKSRLFIILMITIVYMFSLSMTRPTVSLYAIHLGISPFLLGLLISAFAVFPILFSVQSGKWCDRIGSKRMIYMGLSVVLVALIIPAAFTNIITLFFSQALIGLGHNFMMIAVQRGAGSASGNRDKAIASLSFANSIGEFGGPLVSGFAYEYLGLPTTFLFAAILILPIFVLNFLLTGKQILHPPRNTTDKKKESSFLMLKNVKVRKALVISGLAIYSKDLFVAYFPLYGSKIGLSPSQIGIVLAMSAIAAMFVRAVQYSLVKNFTRSVVLMGSLFLGGTAYVLIPFLQQFVILCAVAVLLGIGLGLGQPLSMVYILNSSPPGREGELLGMRITFNRLCQLIAPSFFGLLGGTMGISPIFWTCGAFLLSGSWYSRENSEKPVSSENQEVC